MSQKAIPLDSSSQGIPYVVQSQSNNMVSKTVNKKWLIDNKEPPTIGNKIVLGVTLPAISYQPYEFGASQVITMAAKWFNSKNGVFIVRMLNNLIKSFSYSNKPGMEIYKNSKVLLPVKNSTINFDFIDNFMQQIELSRVAKVKQYLQHNDLLTTNLNKDEKMALASIETKPTEMFNLKSLFGTSTRGKRLKSEDRLSGSLPFVTAGEADQGVSAFISNDVTIFDKNTITIDMFGSAKYRNYDYGCDDHVAVVHTQDLSKKSVIFLTTAIHRTSYNGQFNYGRNFYAKDADELNILLPVKDDKPDYEFMEIYISAVQKLTVKSVISYLDKKNS